TSIRWGWVKPGVDRRSVADGDAFAKGDIAGDSRHIVHRLWVVPGGISDLTVVGLQVEVVDLAAPVVPAAAFTGYQEITAHALGREEMLSTHENHVITCCEH